MPAIVRMMCFIGALGLCSSLDQAHAQNTGSTDCDSNILSDWSDIWEERFTDCDLDGAADQCKMAPPAFELTRVPYTHLDNGSINPLSMKMAQLDAQFAWDSLGYLNGELIVRRASGSGTYLAEERFAAPLNGTLAEIVSSPGPAAWVALVSSSEILVLKNNGAGVLSAGTGVSVAPISETIKFTDVTGDSLPDLIYVTQTTSPPGRAFHVLRGNSDGSFTPVFEKTVSGIGALAPAVGDIDQDGVADILFGFTSAVNNSQGFFLKSQAGVPLALETAVPESSVLGNQFELADFDGDSKIDLVLVNSSSSTVLLFKNLSGGVFGPPKSALFLGSLGTEIQVEDVNRDGFPDLLTVRSFRFTSCCLSSSRSFLLNDTHGNFRYAGEEGSTSFTGTSNSRYSYLGIFDIDEDGMDEAIYANCRFQNLSPEVCTLIKNEIPAHPGGGSSLDTDANNALDTCDAAGFRTAYTGLWNGYLNQINILEVTNSGTDTEVVSVRLRGIDGTAHEALQFLLAGGGKFDVIADALPGFSNDSYGLVELRSTGKVQGRLSRYRPAQVRAADRGDYDFAVSMPLSVPLTEPTFLPFNTNQPSPSSADANNPVANWISVVNLGSAPEVFKVSTYLQGGALHRVREFSLRPYERIDLEGGHESPGRGNVGLHKVESVSPGVPYISELTRYGLTENPDQIRFALPFLGTPALKTSPPYLGYGTTTALPISRGAGGENFIELANPTSSIGNYLIRFFGGANDSGSDQLIVALAPFDVVHIPIADRLPAGGTGYLTIQGSVSSLSLTSVFYFPDPQRRISTAYADQLFYNDGSDSNSGTMSFNLYLGMYNWLKLVERSGSASPVNVTLTRDGSVVFNQGFMLPSFGTLDLPLHEYSRFGTAPDSYGVVTVTPSSRATAQLLRLRPTSRGYVDFAVPERMK